ncbi:MAG: DNA translocase FtsK [Candidatus Merdivicinus sp.]
MAESKDSTTKKRKTTGKTSRSKQAQPRSRRSVAELAEKERERRNQMAAVFLFAAGIFITALALIPGGSGWLALHNFLRGLFGPISYLVGPVIIYLAVILTLGKETLSASNKLWQMAVLIVLLCGISQLFFGLPTEKTFFARLGSFFIKGIQLKSGGLFAILTGWPLMRFAGGVLGAAIIQILLVFIFVMLISGSTLKGFFTTCAKPVKHIEKTYTASRERREEQQRSHSSRIDIPMGGEEPTMPEHPVLAPDTGFDQALENFRLDPRELRRRKKEAEKLGLKIDPLTGEVLEEGTRTPPVPQQPESVQPERDPFRPDQHLDSRSLWGAPVTPQQTDEKAAAVVEPSTDTSRSIEEFFPETSADDRGQAVFSLSSETSLQQESARVSKPTNPDSLWGASLSPSQMRALQENSSDSADNSSNEEPHVDVAAFDKLKASVLEGAAQSDDAFGANPPSLGEAAGESLADNRLNQAIHAMETPPSDSNAPAPGIRLCQPAEIEETYRIPPVTLLKMPKNEGNIDVSEELKANAAKLVDTLNSFGVQTRVIAYSRGPTVTRYELQPLAGVKISKITGLADDIALNLATAGVRIEAPIPNKPAVGIEVPNKKTDSVSIRELIDSDEFRNAKGTLPIALGRDIAGNIAIGDIASMPHLLVAGTTGSGKSVCVNSMIISLLYQFSPKDVRMILIDPKVVEMGIYNGIPHLLIPVVTDPKKAAGALNWAVTEMMKRYAAFAENSVRDIKGYNRLAENNPDLPHMPQVVIIIDELADLMMAAPNEVEDAICRLAQMARAAGMHLIIATQRPSVDVVTGLIKANIPSRIALSVSSQVDSRTILDTGGAEKLLGRGDMLYAPMGFPKPVRVQGCFVSDSEIEAVVDFIKSGGEPVVYDAGIMDEIERQAAADPKKKGNSSADSGQDDVDELFEDAVQCILDAGQCSTSYLQRRLKVGYARAARLVDDLENRGIVGPPDGSKPREVLITRAQWAELQMRNQMDN